LSDRYGVVSSRTKATAVWLFPAITRRSPKSASEQLVQVRGRGEFALPRWTQSHLPVSQGPIVRLPSFGLAIGASGLQIARSMTEPIVPPINAKVSPMLKHCI
jgi:hypothetical protein